MPVVQNKKNEQIFFNFLVGVLEIKIQLGRSLTRRWELRRLSNIGLGKNATHRKNKTKKSAGIQSFRFTEFVAAFLAYDETTMLIGGCTR